MGRWHPSSSQCGRWLLLLVLHVLHLFYGIFLVMVKIISELERRRRRRSREEQEKGTRRRLASEQKLVNNPDEIPKKNNGWWRKLTRQTNEREQGEMADVKVRRLREYEEVGKNNETSTESVAVDANNYTHCYSRAGKGSFITTTTNVADDSNSHKCLQTQQLSTTCFSSAATSSTKVPDHLVIAFRWEAFGSEQRLVRDMLEVLSFCAHRRRPIPHLSLLLLWPTATLMSQRTCMCCAQKEQHQGPHKGREGEHGGYSESVGLHGSLGITAEQPAVLLCECCGTDDVIRKLLELVSSQRTLSMSVVGPYPMPPQEHMRRCDEGKKEKTTKKRDGGGEEKNGVMEDERDADALDYDFSVECCCGGMTHSGANIGEATGEPTTEENEVSGEGCSSDSCSGVVVVRRCVKVRVLGPAAAHEDLVRVCWALRERSKEDEWREDVGTETSTTEENKHQKQSAGDEEKENVVGNNFKTTGTDMLVVVGRDQQEGKTKQGKREKETNEATYNKSVFADTADGYDEMADGDGSCGDDTLDSLMVQTRGARRRHFLRAHGGVEARQVYQKLKCGGSWPTAKCLIILNQQIEGFDMRGAITSTWSTILQTLVSSCSRQNMEGEAKKCCSSRSGIIGNKLWWDSLCVGVCDEDNVAGHRKCCAWWHVRCRVLAMARRCLLEMYKGENSSRQETKKTSCFADRAVLCSDALAANKESPHTNLSNYTTPTTSTTVSRTSPSCFGFPVRCSPGSSTHRTSPRHHYPPLPSPDRSSFHPHLSQHSSPHPPSLLQFLSSLIRLFSRRLSAGRLWSHIAVSPLGVSRVCPWLLVEAELMEFAEGEAPIEALREGLDIFGGTSKNLGR
eukprot:GHVS01034086.1.p1 GENE.GHVS01034086.1~~GHVS01034086.1.p1  ORF type:complete len:851 (+),score=189.78 GHVS01034086.1:67-2619(+)